MLNKLYNLQKKNDVMIIKYLMIIIITYNKVIICHLPQYYIII